MKSKISNFYKRNVIHICDNFLPLGGKLAVSGIVLLKKYLSEELLNSGSSKIAQFVSEDKEVKDIVGAYTGRTEIEFMEEWEAPDHSSSGTWHHDSVGHRIKAFVALTSATGKAGTEYIIGTQMNKYTDYSHTRVEVNESENRIDLIQQDRGDLLIFDTNGLHRGLYGDGQRKILQFEFGTGIKGKMLPGHIGKR